MYMRRMIRLLVQTHCTNSYYAIKKILLNAYKFLINYFTSICIIIIL